MPEADLFQARYWDPRLNSGHGTPPRSSRLRTHQRKVSIWKRTMRFSFCLYVNSLVPDLVHPAHSLPVANHENRSLVPSGARFNSSLASTSVGRLVYSRHCFHDSSRTELHPPPDSTWILRLDMFAVKPQRARAARTSAWLRAGIWPPRGVRDCFHLRPLLEVTKPR